MLIYTCYAHAALCRGLEKLLSERHGRGVARARHGMCEINTAALCNSNGKDNLNFQGHGMARERHGRNMGAAWAQNGNGMVYVNEPLWSMWNGSTVFNPLTPNDLKRRQAVSPLKLKIPNKNMRENKKCNNYSFSLLIMYGSFYMFRHYNAIFRERS
jgi:hypothetical protein